MGRGLLDEHDIPLEHVHTSGHVGVAQLRRLVDAMSEARVVPMHSGAGHRHASLFPAGRGARRWRVVGRLMALNSSSTQMS